MSKACLLALVAALAVGETAHAAEPANSLSTLFVELNHCLSPMKLAEGTDVTVRFMLNRRGELIGKPRITHAKWPADAPREAAASIAEGFGRCLPVAITDSLGGAIAGRLISYRLQGRPGREDKT